MSKIGLANKKQGYLMAISQSLYHSLYFCEYLNSYDKLFKT